MPNYVINEISLSGSSEAIEKALSILRSKENKEEIDFNNVVKMPISLNVVSGSVAEDYIAAFLKTLRREEVLYIAEKLKEKPAGFYGNYLKKYRGAFVNGFDEAKRKRLEDTFKEDFKEINPDSIEAVGKVYIDNIINYGVDTWYDWCVENWGTKWQPWEPSIDDDYVSFYTAWSAPVAVIQKLSKMVPSVTFTHEYADEDIGNNCGKLVYKAGEIIEEYYPEGKEAIKFSCEKWGNDYREYMTEPLTLEEVLEPYNIGLKVEGNTIVLQDFGKPGSEYDGLTFDITGNELSEIITAIDGLLKEDYEQFVKSIEAKGISTEGIFLEDLIDIVPTDVANYNLFYNIVHANDMMSIKALEQRPIDKVISEAKGKSEASVPATIETDPTKEL